jgi:hypothetical protein
MAQVRLPLSVDEQQRICDEANPFFIPAIIDLLSRCQDALLAIRDEAERVRSGNREDKDYFPRYVLGIIDQLLPRKRS